MIDWRPGVYYLKAADKLMVVGKKHLGHFLYDTMNEKTVWEVWLKPDEDIPFFVELHKTEHTDLAEYIGEFE